MRKTEYFYKRIKIKTPLTWITCDDFVGSIEIIIWE